MEIRRKTTLRVKPVVQTTRRSITLTPLDMIFSFPHYASCLNIYRSPGKGSIVDDNKVRESLSKTLVHFYPLAGRYRQKDNESAIEIDCDDTGVIYVEAETDSDLGDFTPSSEMSLLLPTIDNSTQPISSYPLLVVQVTYFKCGGVSIGVRVEHHCMDGSSTFHFMCSWSEVARGLDISAPPFLDRASLIHPRNPPQPKFDHPELVLLKPTTHFSQTSGRHLKVSVFKLTKDQINKMKAKVGDYNTFEVVAGHIWKCVCKARGLGRDQETILMLVVNARFNRWKPELPRKFFGNAILPALVVARGGDLESYAAAQIHKTLVRTDSEFFRTVVDGIDLFPDSINPLIVPSLAYEFDPNFHINTWDKLGIKDVDFGWGQPIYMGPAAFDFESACIIPHDNDGSIHVVIALRPPHMKIFHRLFYAPVSQKNDTSFFVAKL